MKSVMQLLRDCSLIVFVLVYGLHYCTQAASSEPSSSCTYFFIRQPHTDMSCNPWPIIIDHQLTIDLSCHIRGAQSNDLPNAVWYHSRENDITERIEIDNVKYRNPTSNGDLGNGFRRVNFTLHVSSVSELEDVGCYWCEVVISADNCSFSLINSTKFCLYSEATYISLPDCTSLPTNDSMVCAANMVCDSPSSVTPTIVRTTLLPMPTTLDPSSTTQSSVPSDQPTPIVRTTLLPMPTTLDPSSTTQSSVPSDQPTPMPSTSPIVSQETDTQSNDSKSITMVFSTSTYKYATSLPTPMSISPSSSPLAVGTESDQSNRNSGLSALQISFYIGLSVCVVLLVIILTLSAVVVLLCRKKPSKHSSNAGIVSESSTGDQDRVWRRESGVHLSTSVVNSSSSFALLSPWSQPNDHNDDEDDPLYSSVDRGEHTHPLEDSQSSFSSTQGQNSTNSHIPMRHTSKEVKGSVSGKSSKVITTERVPSPEAHYYHVLEQPEYYNYDWLSSNSNGRELLLQSWREKIVNGRERADGKNEWQSVGLAVEDETGEEQYHWKVVPTAKQHLPVRERLGSKSSVSRGSLGSKSSVSRGSQQRHLYQRLDQATMETAREYAKVSITQSEGASENKECI